MLTSISPSGMAYTTASGHRSCAWRRASRSRSSCSVCRMYTWCPRKPSPTCRACSTAPCNISRCVGTRPGKRTDNAPTPLLADKPKPLRLNDQRPQRYVQPHGEAVRLCLCRVHWQGETATLSTEILQQRLGLVQIHCLKTLGEPAVDRCQEFAGLVPFTLLLPQPCQARGRAQLQRHRLLVAGHRQGLVKTRLRFGWLRRVAGGVRPTAFRH